MEKLYYDDKIVLRDVESVYEALFLRAVTGFEDLFISILEGRTRYRPRGRVTVRMTAVSSDALKEILLQGNRYMTWLPFDNTEKRANIYLRDGKPFSELSSGDRSMLKTITTIRHAIAHKSTHAMNEFERTVIGSQALLRRERRPAGFLRSQARANPSANRFEIYVGELGRIAGGVVLANRLYTGITGKAGDEKG
jgi:hypothetical protein